MNSVDFATAFVLSVVAAISACGASGNIRAFLSQFACSLSVFLTILTCCCLGWFQIGVIQDSWNSPTFYRRCPLTAVAEYAATCVYTYQGKPAYVLSLRAFILTYWNSMFISQRMTKLILATPSCLPVAYFLNLSSAVSGWNYRLSPFITRRSNFLKLARNRLFLCF